MTSVSTLTTNPFWRQVKLLAAQLSNSNWVLVLAWTGKSAVAVCRVNLLLGVARDWTTAIRSMRVARGFARGPGGGRCAALKTPGAMETTVHVAGVGFATVT